MKPLSDIYTNPKFISVHLPSGRTPVFGQSFMDIFQFKSVIDVGCNVGEFLQYFYKNGVEDICGVDGLESVIPHLCFPREKFILHDLRQPFIHHRTYDLCLCLEVAEHIEPEYTDVFLDSLAPLSDTLFMSAARPKQKGEYHVNCQRKEYWIEKMSQRGFSVDNDTTQKWIDIIVNSGLRRHHYTPNILCYRRNK